VTAGPWRMFLSSRRVVRTRFGRLLASTLRRANCPHGSTPSSALDYGCSFRPLATPEQLPSPRRRRWGRLPRRRVTEPFRHAYRSGLPGDPRGTPRRRGTLTGQCGQPLCPGETTSHLDGPQRPTVACAAEGDRRVPQCFGRLGSVACRLGRNVTPPELSLPGPFVAARCRTTLAA
jgi:hypothetical protein